MRKHRESQWLREKQSVTALGIAVTLLFGFGLRGEGGVIYDSIPAPFSNSNGNPPPGAAGLSSLFFQANETTEIGDHIRFASGGRSLTQAVVTMVTAARQSDSPGANSEAWTHPVTLNLYSVDRSGTDPAVGALLYSTTQMATVPWLASRGSGTSHGGDAFNVTFALPDVRVSDEVIFGIAFNTQGYGPAPLGVAGPYDLLGVGLHGTSPGPPIRTGSDLDAGILFWNTSNGANYGDGGAGGVGVFRGDTSWSGRTPAIQFVASNGASTGPDSFANPEPASLTLFGLGVAGIAVYRRRRERA